VSALLFADWTLLGRQIANHLWQSTLFAAVAGMLALSLRNNHARVRHWLWMAASVKFLVPFSLIVAFGAYVGSSIAPRTAAPRIPAVAVEIAQPFALSEIIAIPSAPAPTQTPSPLPIALVAVWFFGFAVIPVNWQRQWRRVARIVNASTPLTEGREADAFLRVRRDGAARLRLVSSDARLEPGLFGIFRPVLWLPKGIADYLSDAQLEAILAHELCHARRRDNLLAAVHMVVEAAFWFHPLVWWLGSRLEEERERACDEEVLRLTGEPQAYAEGVLKVCEFYLTSPVFCAAGVTGADLKIRIKSIVANRSECELNFAKKVLLAAATATVIAVPITVGWWSRVAQAAVEDTAVSAAMTTGEDAAPGSQGQSRTAQVTADPAAPSAQTSSPPAAVTGVVSPKPGRAQSHSEPVATTMALTFEVASVKPSAPQAVGVRIRHNPEMVEYGNAALIDILSDAYNVNNRLISGPSSLSDRYDILARIPKGVPATQTPAMLQALLVDRFKLKVHHETKLTEAYVLAVGKGGPWLDRAQDDAVEAPPGAGFQPVKKLRFPNLGFKASGATMASFAVLLASYLNSYVLDETGLKGRYNFTFNFDYIFDEDVIGHQIPSSLFAGVERLGLKLEYRKVPVDYLVVGHIEKIPIPN
jgi:bla regulator protein blaR1